MFVNSTEPKARSRLSVSDSTSQVEASPPPQIKRNRLKKTRNFSFSIPTVPKFHMPQTSTLLVTYFQRIPFLAISLILFSVLIYIFFNVHPAQVANWLLFQSYIPIHFLFLFAVMFFTRFLTGNKHLAWSISCWLTFLLFLKLQSFLISPLVIGVSALLLVGPALIWPVLFKE
ncbi:MAG: hypothetical protein QG639_135 [Patescibacteria group bacterium]|nr:hypothetical protein [Patescibacteria group bacterium]